MKRCIIGLDLEQEYSQISYYNERNAEVESVSVSKEKEKYLIKTPVDLFRITEEAMDLGIMSLSNFIKNCISCIQPLPEPEAIYIMITMREITGTWIHSLRLACEMIGIPKEHVCLQTYRESFFYYVINQKREIWGHASTLFEYDHHQISSYIMKIDYSTRPALVTVTPSKVLKLAEQGGLDEQKWNEYRDRSFLDQIKELFQGENVSSTFLVGDDFDKSWAVESLYFLCKKRHVFQGRNLYTKGACYGMCSRLKVGKDQGAFLYKSEDLVDTNLSMKLDIRGRQSNYIMINAGNNWYDAIHTCEIILDHEEELVFYGKSMMGGDVMSYSVPLTDLPKRPKRTTRLQVTAEFLEAKKCRITIKDLGFGEFFPSSNQIWESILHME